VLRFYLAVKSSAELQSNVIISFATSVVRIYLAFQRWEEGESILGNTAVPELGKSRRGIRLPPNTMLLSNAHCVVGNGLWKLLF